LKYTKKVNPDEGSLKEKYRNATLRHIIKQFTELCLEQVMSHTGSGGSYYEVQVNFSLICLNLHTESHVYVAFPLGI